MACITYLLLVIFLDGKYLQISLLTFVYNLQSSDKLFKNSLAIIKFYLTYKIQIVAFGFVVLAISFKALEIVLPQKDPSYAHILKSLQEVF